MIIDFKFASLVISLFCHLLSPLFISDMAYTRHTLQLEERIYAVQNYYLLKSYKNVIDHWNKSFDTPPLTKSTIYKLIQDITLEMCKKVTESITKRCHHCIANNGLHFEHLL